MKKILFALLLSITMCLGANAQSDGFFKSEEGYRDQSSSDLPTVPTGPVGTIPDSDAPLGSGLLVLTVLGGAYALRQKRS